MTHPFTPALCAAALMGLAACGETQAEREANRAEAAERVDAAASATLAEIEAVGEGIAEGAQRAVEGVRDGYERAKEEDDRELERTLSEAGEAMGEGAERLADRVRGVGAPQEPDPPAEDPDAEPETD